MHENGEVTKDLPVVETRRALYSSTHHLILAFSAETPKNEKDYCQDGRPEPLGSATPVSTNPGTAKMGRHLTQPILGNSALFPETSHVYRVPLLGGGLLAIRFDRFL